MCTSCRSLACNDSPQSRRIKPVCLRLCGQLSRPCVAAAQPVHRSNLVSHSRLHPDRPISSQEPGHHRPFTGSRNQCHSQCCRTCTLRDSTSPSAPGCSCGHACGRQRSPHRLARCRTSPQWQSLQAAQPCALLAVVSGHLEAQHASVCQCLPIKGTPGLQAPLPYAIAGISPCVSRRLLCMSSPAIWLLCGHATQHGAQSHSLPPRTPRRQQQRDGARRA